MNSQATLCLGAAPATPAAAIRQRPLVATRGRSLASLVGVNLRPIFFCLRLVEIEARRQGRSSVLLGDPLFVKKEASLEDLYYDMRTLLGQMNGQIS